MNIEREPKLLSEKIDKTPCIINTIEITVNFDTQSPGNSLSIEKYMVEAEVLIKIIDKINKMINKICFFHYDKEKYLGIVFDNSKLA